MGGNVATGKFISFFYCIVNAVTVRLPMKTPGAALLNSCAASARRFPGAVAVQ